MGRLKAAIAARAAKEHEDVRMGRTITPHSFTSPEDLLDQLGVEYARNPHLMRSVLTAPIGECFRNAARLVLNDPNLTYVEGFATNLAACPHAWCIDLKGVVVDPTWGTEGLEYIGVPFRRETLLGIDPKGFYGLLADDDIAVKIFADPFAYINYTLLPMAKQPFTAEELIGAFQAAYDHIRTGEGLGTLTPRQKAAVKLDPYGTIMWTEAAATQVQSALTKGRPEFKEVLVVAEAARNLSYDGSEPTKRSDFPTV